MNNDDIQKDFEETWVDLRPDKFPRMSDEDLSQFVLDYCDGKILVAEQVPKDLLPMVFMPIALGCFADWKEGHLNQIGTIWERLDSRNIMPRSINGYPMFGSLRILRTEDWERAKKAISREMTRREEAKKTVLDGL